MQHALTASQLGVHPLIHLLASQNPLVCVAVGCGKVFAKKQGLSTHIKSCEKRWTCAKCKTGCRNERSLNAHSAHCQPRDASTRRLPRNKTRRELTGLIDHKSPSRREQGGSRQRSCKKEQHPEPKRTSKFKSRWTKELIDDLFHGIHLHGLLKWNTIIKDSNYGFTKAKFPERVLSWAYRQILCHVARRDSRSNLTPYTYVHNLSEEDAAVGEDYKLLVSPPRSINRPRNWLVEQWNVILEHPRCADPEHCLTLVAEDAEAHRWSPSEVAHLVSGIRTYGYGNWKAISEALVLPLNRRTPGNLKDKARNIANSHNKASLADTLSLIY